MVFNQAGLSQLKLANSKKYLPAHQIHYLRRDIQSEHESVDLKRWILSGSYLDLQSSLKLLALVHSVALKSACNKVLDSELSYPSRGRF